MANGATTYEFEKEVEQPHVEPWSVTLAEHDWTAGIADADLAALGLPSAEERRTGYRVIVDVDSDLGRVEMPLNLRVERGDGNGSWAYHATGTQYRLNLTFELRQGAGAIHWHLAPGGRDAAGRAAVLDFLIAMSGNGVLVLRDPDHGVLARLRLSAQPLQESLHQERQFLTDVLAIEAWSRRKLPLPDDVDDDSGELIATLVHWIRERKIRVRFTSNITGLVTESVLEADELRLHEDVEYMLFGVWVRLGRLNYRVPGTVVGHRREGEQWRIEFRPSKAWLTATITPPHGVASIRRVRRIDEGHLPPPSRPRHTRRRGEALRAAEQLINDRQLDEPEDDDIRDEIRRQWPT